MFDFTLVASSKEQKKLHKGFAIKYIFKENKFDTDHLIVVFSGFGGKSAFTYDFKTGLENNRAYILWIKDDFFDNEYATYYLDPVVGAARSNLYPLENAIVSFINEVINFTGVKKCNVTILGASKGGASALYYGIKYNFSNILVSAPVIKIGSSVAGIEPSRKRPKASAYFMLGNALANENIELIDSYIVDVLSNDTSLEKNIYFLASEMDDRYEGQQKPFFEMFEKYSNFNLILPKSLLITEHKDVTKHNAPFILSLLGVLCFNSPRFLKKDLTFIGLDKTSMITKEPVLELDYIEIRDDDKLYLGGVFFLRGLSCASYSDLDYYLILESDAVNYEIRIAKGSFSEISKNYFKNSYINYDKAYFTTTSYAGLDMSKISNGLYKIAIKILMHKNGDTVTLSMPCPRLPLKNLGILHKLSSRDGEVYFEKFPSLTPVF